MIVKRPKVPIVVGPVLLLIITLALVVLSLLFFEPYFTTNNAHTNSVVGQNTMHCITQYLESQGATIEESYCEGNICHIKAMVGNEEVEVILYSK